LRLREKKGKLKFSIRPRCARKTDPGGWNTVNNDCRLDFGKKGGLVNSSVGLKGKGRKRFLAESEKGKGEKPGGSGKELR